jgi:hypothetical protein
MQQALLAALYQLILTKKLDLPSRLSKEAMVTLLLTTPSSLSTVETCNVLKLMAAQVL